MPLENSINSVGRSSQMKIRLIACIPFDCNQNHLFNDRWRLTLLICLSAFRLCTSIHALRQWVYTLVICIWISFVLHLFEESNGWGTILGICANKINNYNQQIHWNNCVEMQKNVVDSSIDSITLQVFASAIAWFRCIHWFYYGIFCLHVWFIWCLVGGKSSGERCREIKHSSTKQIDRGRWETPWVLRIKRR